MPWYYYFASFAAGVFLANAVPHFVKGICGDRFPTPFAKPPGRGLSSPLVNVVWALVNVAVGYTFWHLGRVWSGDTAAVVIFFAGVAALSMSMSLQFAKKDIA